MFQILGEGRPIAHATPDPGGEGNYTPHQIFFLTKRRRFYELSCFSQLNHDLLNRVLQLYLQSLPAKLKLRLRSIREMHPHCKREDARSSRAASSSIVNFAILLFVHFVIGNVI